MRTHHPLKTTALAWVIAGTLSAASAIAQTPAAPPPAPAAPPAAAAPAPVSAETRAASLEERVNDLEQYFNNLAAGPAADAKPEAQYKSKLAGLAGPGHNAFMMICAALVLFMTLPGLALFYGGLVRSKNVLSVLAQCLGLAGMVTILWFICGYSFVFGEHPAEGAPGWAPYLGSLKYCFLAGVDGAPNTNYTAWPSQNVFSMYQLMFAIITPGLIVGAIAERMKFTAIMVFCAIWMFVVYFPLAHMVWGFDGLMNGVWNGGAAIPAIDFAGGTVVHMSSGWSALVLCILLGKRQGFGKEKMAPHSMVLCMVGTGMLWVGWYGFNAGSALAADGIAANAFTTTTLAAATASFVWALVEKIHKGKPSILGFCSGVVAGLVVITPAAGFVNAKGAMIIGVLAAIVPYVAVVFAKAKLGYDDALDTFGVHGVGGTLGAIITGVLVDPKVNSNLTGAYAVKNGLAKLATEGGLLGAQLKAALLTIVLSVAATVVITLAVKAFVGLRPSPEDESMGLDLADHGEAGYEM
ncbi:MAG: ammonium transporter [Verrucomicrobiaceae bacterium]|nr:ammonium transporter [Verrucomicrobiaceae bacterium]